MQDDIESIIMSYVGSTLSPKLLQGIRHKYLLRRIRCSPMKYLHYDIYSSLFTAVKVIDLCICTDCLSCGNPYCQRYGRYVQFIAQHRDTIQSDVYRVTAGAFDIP